MAAFVKTGKSIAWSVPVNCQCGERIFCYPTEVHDRYVSYNFWCKACDLEGPWRSLALGILERSGDRRAFK